MYKTKSPFLMLFFIVVVLFALQLLRIGMKNLFFIFVNKTYFTDRIASLIYMTLISSIILIVSFVKKEHLNFLPKHFGISYVITSLIYVLLIISTPIITKDYSVNSIVLLLNSALVVPLFEELIFRSLIWNRLNLIFNRDWITYIFTTLLFSLWHFGYADSIYLRVNGDILKILLWKVVTALCFGLVLGALRLKTKNSYSTTLLHGALNIFGR